MAKTLKHKLISMFIIILAVIFQNLEQTVAPATTPSMSRPSKPLCATSKLPGFPLKILCFRGYVHEQ